VTQEIRTHREFYYDTISERASQSEVGHGSNGKRPAQSMWSLSHQGRSCTGNRNTSNSVGQFLLRIDTLNSDYITETMRTLDPDGFASREPTARKIQRGTLVAVGPHDEWSCDGHDKLVKYGFPIWGVRDKWGGKWLGLWVIPNNRYKDVIAYLWLSLVKDLGGRSLASRSMLSHPDPS
jgi:hypothetical protein